MAQRWLQIKGDPAVRQFLFDQHRVDNEFDRQIDRVLARIRVAMVSRDVSYADQLFKRRGDAGVPARSATPLNPRYGRISFAPDLRAIPNLVVSR